VPLQKNINLVIKGWIWPVFRKVLILIGILAVLIYVAGKINWEPIENWVIDQLAHQEPIGNQSSLLFLDKVDIIDTKAYTNEKYMIFNTKNKISDQFID
jgi:hypothetical protein